jgi:nickel-dependent lactate racemase
MSGYNRPALKPAGIKAALDKPIGTPTIRELARGKKDVVIIFDDQTRITRSALIVPFILEELAEAGITEKNMRFICGLGMHAAMTRFDFVKKLGADVVAKYRVYNHNPFGQCVYIGTTKLFQTPVYVNEEVALCDLKIAITGCVPHPNAGFGGGGKIVLPGITSFETTKWLHSKIKNPSQGQGEPQTDMGKIDHNRFREDIDQAAELAKIDFGISVIVNEWGDPAAIYAGALRAAHAEAVKEARTHYRTPRVAGKDVVIANTYAKVNEALIGLDAAVPAVSTSGGDIVLVANAPEGQITHYLIGPFGRTTWARKASLGLPPNIRHLIVYSEYPHPGSSWLAEDERVLYMAKWAEVVQFLKKSHGAGTRVAVFPDATNQYVA